MNMLLTSVGLLVVITGSMAIAIGKIEADEYLKNAIESMTNLEDEELQVTETKSNLLAKFKTNKVFDWKEEKQILKTKNITNEDNLNTTAVFKKILNLIKSLNYTGKDSKFAECAYKSVTDFVLCELHGLEEREGKFYLQYFSLS